MSKKIKKLKRPGQGLPQTKDYEKERQERKALAKHRYETGEVAPPVWDKDDYLSPCSFPSVGLSCFPKPHVRRYPNTHGIRRHVGVNLTTYLGISLGAMHYYVKFDEDPNPVWHGYEGKWLSPQDDPPIFKGGDTYDKQLSCLTFDEALERARRVVDEHYKGWEVEWTDHTGGGLGKQWKYKEGD